jgi:predicted enzyme related to lactoylglutathione lyase
MRKVFQKSGGKINGGFYERSNNKPAQYPSIVIAVDNIDEAMKKVIAAGGQVFGEPVEITGFGMYISVLDTEGNRVSMTQPLMR